MNDDQPIDSHADPAGSAGRRGTGRPRARPRQTAQLDRARSPRSSPSASLSICPRISSSARAGFQFEINPPWIDNPAIFYHVGVDGLSLWLVVLTGLLAPIGVLASWNAIQERRKIFYSLFLVQQTAMFGVFISLDLMLYYGFWELSLVPMAILIAMYGRKDGPRPPSSSSSSPSFHRRRCWSPSCGSTRAPARFDFATLQITPSPAEHFPPPPLLGRPRVPVRLRRQGSRLSAARLARRHIQ